MVSTRHSRQACGCRAGAVRPWPATPNGLERPSGKHPALERGELPTPKESLAAGPEGDGRSVTGEEAVYRKALVVAAGEYHREL
jgi:hypothetical protein